MATGDVIAYSNEDGDEVFAVDQDGVLTAPTLATTGAATVGTLLTTGVTTVAMGDAAHALVLGTAGAGETQLVGNVVVVDPESSGASETLTIPAAATCAGMILVILNSGGEGVVVDSSGTIITLDTAQAGIVASDGTTWRGFMGSIT